MKPAEHPWIDVNHKEDLLQCRDADRREFRVEGRTCFLLEPRGGVPESRPWVWYAPTFVPRLPKQLHRFYITRLLEAGIHVGGIDVGESWGNPEGRAAFTRFHDHVTSTWGLEKRACLWAQSRGGLMHYNWAVDHPDRVKCVAAIYALVNATEPLQQHIFDAHGLSSEAFASQRHLHNPIDRLAPLARAGVPVYHIHGDADTLVPFTANAVEWVGRYREAAGSSDAALLQRVPGKGHEEIAEFFTSLPFIDWLIARALA